MSDRAAEIERLHRLRPRIRFLRWSASALVAMAALAWASGEIDVRDLFSARRMDNVTRFVTEQAAPHPMRGKPFESGALAEWARPIVVDRGLPGLRATLAISVLSIVLAAAAGLLLALPAARTLMAAAPFLPGGRPPGPLRRFTLGALVRVARFAHLFLRSIPEYVWAYLLLMLLGPSAWPAVLALAIHNAGILGKLFSETVENAEPESLRALRGLGATRGQIAAFAIAPLSFPRFLVYFLYRWETCVREATVLGMLGIVSLGYWIADARGARYYDEMLLLVLLGAGIVFAGDVLSAVARRFVGRAA